MVQMAWFEINIKDLNLNFKVNQALIPSSYRRYMVRVLKIHCSCYSDTRGVTGSPHLCRRRIES
jgi:hypothetical protein